MFLRVATLIIILCVNCPEELLSWNSHSLITESADRTLRTLANPPKTLSVKLAWTYVSKFDSKLEGMSGAQQSVLSQSPSPTYHPLFPVGRKGQTIRYCDYTSYKLTNKTKGLASSNSETIQDGSCPISQAEFTYSGA